MHGRQKISDTTKAVPLFCIHSQSCFDTFFDKLKVTKLISSFNTNNYANSASLKALTTTPPMTAAQHSMLMRERTEKRRMIEDAKEQKAE